MKTDLKISLIIPIYNVALFLNKCLSSIMEQTYSNFEVIMINDGSTDCSEAICKEFDFDDRFVLINQYNKGASRARNNGLKVAKGDYVAFVDADDWLEDTFLENLLKYVKDDKTDLIVCGYYDHSVHAVNLGLNDFTKNDIITLSNLDVVGKLFNGVAGVPWAKLYNMQIIKSYNIRFNPNIVMSEDLVFNLDYLHYCKSVIALPNHLYNYNRLNYNSISSKLSIHYLSSYTFLLESIKERLNKFDFSIDKIDRITNEKLGGFIRQAIYNHSLEDSLGLNNRRVNILHFLKQPLILNFLQLNNQNMSFEFFLIDNNLIFLLVIWNGLINSLSKIKLHIKNTLN